MNNELHQGGRSVGIAAMWAYFPHTYVNQTDLEKYYNVPAGKHTEGLKQTNMAVCNDREDTCSICMTAVQEFMDLYRIPYERIGFLEVGTETLIDTSKSIKSMLMRLWNEKGLYNIEGVDCINACYGATAALFHAVSYCQSPYWDGRWALVVAADIAVYDKGNARATGGAGVVVMLVKDDAVLVFNENRTSYFEHAYDFYKPNPHSEYPVVDGHYSIGCYNRALRHCVDSLCRKEHVTVTELLDSRMDYFLFHTPFVKMTVKAYHSLNAVRQPQLQPAQLQLQYEKQVAPGTYLSSQLGNSYTASLYMSLISLFLHQQQPPVQALHNKNLLLFSYGSGLAATLFSVHVNLPASTSSSSSLSSIPFLHSELLRTRLQQRIRLTPEQFESYLDQREQFQLQNCRSGTIPTLMGSIEQLRPGTYYLAEVTKQKHRIYKRFQPVQSKL